MLIAQNCQLDEKIFAKNFEKMKNSFDKTTVFYQKQRVVNMHYERHHNMKFLKLRLV